MSDVTGVIPSAFESSVSRKPCYGVGDLREDAWYRYNEKFESSVSRKPCYGGIAGEVDLFNEDLEFESSVSRKPCYGTSLRSLA